jgi:hypothetical protein
VEENGIESLRRSWLSFQQATTWPLIPPGTSYYNLAVSGVTLNAGCHMWFWEAYA